MKFIYPTLSIPLWSDFIPFTLAMHLCIAILSIPLWSDFIDVIVYAKIGNYNDFQSHYGLILSNRSNEKPKQLYSSFQSHYGLILSLRY